MDPEGSNQIGGDKAVGFLKRSGVDPKILREIWEISARTNKSFLNRDEFYIALRLIAYAQNGVPVSETSIRQNVEVELPRF